MINFVRGWKFELGFLLIIGAALAVWAGTMYFSHEARRAREANDYLEQLQAEYANDTYGGATPEETLALFIAALEKGDIELASKYFLPEDRERMLAGLRNVETKGNLTNMITDLHRSRYENKISNENVVYSIANDQGEIALTISFFKNANGIWKISDI